MDLELGSAYEAFRAEVAAFLGSHWPPAREADPRAAAAEFRQAAVDRGYLYRSIPKRYGGSEHPADPLTARVNRE